MFGATGLPELAGPNGLLGEADPPAVLRTRMRAAWVGFAASGDPGWDAYTCERPVTMSIDETWAESDDGRVQPSRT